MAVCQDLSLRWGSRWPPCLWAKFTHCTINYGLFTCGNRRGSAAEYIILARPKQWCFSLGYGFNGTAMCIRHYIIIQTIGSDLALLDKLYYVFSMTLHTKQAMYWFRLGPVAVFPTLSKQTKRHKNETVTKDAKKERDSSANRSGKRELLVLVVIKGFHSLVWMSLEDAESMAEVHSHFIQISFRLVGTWEVQKAWFILQLYLQSKKEHIRGNVRVPPKKANRFFFF